MCDLERLGFVHLNRPSSMATDPLQKSRSAGHSDSHSHFLIMVAERKCSVPVALVAVEWFSVLVHCGFGELRFVSSENQQSCDVATGQMAQMFGNSNSSVSSWWNQQQMFQQSLEMQKQQSQAQMKTLTNLGAAQVAKTTYDARDFRQQRLPR